MIDPAAMMRTFRRAIRRTVQNGKVQMATTDYRAKLEQFFAQVPKTASATRVNQLTGAEYYGEVPSGTPVIPVKKADLAAVQPLIEKAVPVTNEKFEFLTGLTHKRLLDDWKNGGILTSCNSFVGKAMATLGLAGMGSFDVEKTLLKMNKQHCWIMPRSGEKPQFGDLFETRSRTPGNDYFNQHVGITLSVDGDSWYTIEGGQGGPSTGFDKVARVKRKFNTSHVLGWVDMRLLTSGQAAMPDWLIGLWLVFADGQQYHYSFNRYGEVTQKAYRPTAGQNEQVPNLDTGTIIAMVGDTVKVRWDREGGVEVFTYSRWNSFPGVNEKMSGVAADGSAMTGVRL